MAQGALRRAVAVPRRRAARADDRRAWRQARSCGDIHPRPGHRCRTDSAGACPRRLLADRPACRRRACARHLHRGAGFPLRRFFDDRSRRKVEPTKKLFPASLKQEAREQLFSLRIAGKTRRGCHAAHQPCSSSSSGQTLQAGEFPRIRRQDDRLPVKSDVDVILDADSADLRNVNAWLDGEEQARLHERLVLSMHGRLLMHVDPHAMAGAMRKVEAVSVPFDHAARSPVHLCERPSRLHGGQGAAVGLEHRIVDAMLRVRTFSDQERAGNIGAVSILVDAHVDQKQVVLLQLVTAGPAMRQSGSDASENARLERRLVAPENAQPVLDLGIELQLGHSGSGFGYRLRKHLLREGDGFLDELDLSFRLDETKPHDERLRIAEGGLAVQPRQLQVTGVPQMRALYPDDRRLRPSLLLQQSVGIVRIADPYQPAQLGRPAGALLVEGRHQKRITVLAGLDDERHETLMRIAIKAGQVKYAGRRGQNGQIHSGRIQRLFHFEPAMLVGQRIHRSLPPVLFCG
ncbi:hypothetical protein BN871_KT_00020 [Paenibacillus sp. P22]|nr:hypothetical protein BN871_KT_00020 [Paenibacillus sp. P22]